MRSAMKNLAAVLMLIVSLSVSFATRAETPQEEQARLEEEYRQQMLQRQRDRDGGGETNVASININSGPCRGRNYVVHPNGGGLKARTAYVAASVYLERGSIVCNKSRVTDRTRITGSSNISGMAVIDGASEIHASLVGGAVAVTGTKVIHS